MRGKRVWLPILVSVFFLVWLFYGTNFQQMGSAFSKANYVWLIPAVAVYFVGVWFRAWRWRLLLGPLKALSTSRLFPIVVIGYMANDVLPARLGELVKTYILGEKEGISKSSILATVAVERMFDGLALLSFMAIVSLSMPLAGWLQNVIQFSAAFFLGFLVVFLVLASSRSLTAKATGVLLRFLPERLRTKAEAILSLFIGGLAALQSPTRLAGIFATSVLAWLAETVMYWLVMFSFDFRQPFPVLMLTTATANIGITLPSSQGGIGPFEFFARETLGFFGVNSDVATAYTIVLHVALLLPPIALGFFYLWRENLSFGRITSRRAIENEGA